MAVPYRNVIVIFSILILLDPNYTKYPNGMIAIMTQKESNLGILEGREL